MRPNYNMGRTNKNTPNVVNVGRKRKAARPLEKSDGFIWRSGWDSNPRYREVQLISSQSRYDHFDTAPCVFPPAFFLAHFSVKKLLERKAGENTKKYSIFDFASPCSTRVSGGRNGQLTEKFRVKLVMTTSICSRAEGQPPLRRAKMV